MMNIKKLQQRVTAENQVPTQQASTRQTFYTVEQFSRYQPAFTDAALRNLIFKANSRFSTKGEIKGNGLIECGAIIRIGRKVLIHGDKFLEWVQQNGGR